MSLLLTAGLAHGEDAGNKDVAVVTSAPKHPLRNRTAGRKARLAALLVGSTPAR